MKYSLLLISTRLDNVEIYKIKDMLLIILLIFHNTRITPLNLNIWDLEHREIPRQKRIT